MPKIQNSFVNQQDQVTRVTQQELQLCIKHADMTAACMTNDFLPQPKESVQLLAFNSSSTKRVNNAARLT